MNPKFKRGDVIKYRLNHYRIQDVHQGGGGGFWYDVELLAPIIDPTDRVLSIGAGGERDIVLIDPTDVVLDKFEDRLFEVVTHYLKTGEPVTPLNIKLFAKQLRLLT